MSCTCRRSHRDPALLEKLLAEAGVALHRVSEELRLSKQEGSFGGEEELLQEVDEEFDRIATARESRKRHRADPAPATHAYSGNPHDYELTK